MIILIWMVAATVSLLLYCFQIYKRFSKYGVKNLTPIPLLGNNARITFKMEHMADLVQKVYNSFPEESFVGSFEFMSPVLLIRDIELIKKITVKDFEHFLNHRMTINEDVEPFFSRNLFALKGQEWKDMRSTLSPAFTSSKIRLMVPFMTEVAEQMIQSIRRQLKNSSTLTNSNIGFNNYIDVDVRDLVTRYINDVIASCAFGLKVDSHTDKDNVFYKNGKFATNFTFLTILKILGFKSFPKIMSALKVTIFSDDVKIFFRNLILNTMKDREERHIVRPDMIQLLMDAKKGTLTHSETSIKDDDSGFATVEESAVGKSSINKTWTDVDLIAQAVLFFIAGYETVSTAMAFLLHELALNPEVQEKLVKEIQEVHQKNGGKFDYNSIQQMTYLDMVVSESLRLWPPIVATDRICVKDYNLGKPNETSQDYIIRKGEGVIIPVWALHHDPKYFPDPLKFDPERFSEENRHKIKPFTYLPFGLGPRNCIASRFALCEVKVMVYQLLQVMEISPCEKTCIPEVLSKDAFNPRLKGGHWLRIKSRQ